MSEFEFEDITPPQKRVVRWVCPQAGCPTSIEGDESLVAFGAEMHVLSHTQEPEIPQVENPVENEPGPPQPGTEEALVAPPEPDDPWEIPTVPEVPVEPAGD